jgi:mannose-1-phosphate guanylyltransferase
MLYAVIPAGGSGTRLWPLSRAGNPKFLQPLSGTAETLLQATFARVQPLSAVARTYVVTGTAHAAKVARQLPSLPEDNILVEPVPRDSCAAIGLAAAVIAKKDPQALMGSFAADHLIQQADVFVATLRRAARGAAQGLLMTVGMAPTRPETGFGYVHYGELVGPGPIRKVLRFKEKPQLALAKEFVASGDHLWNASMFVWRVDIFLRELQQYCPEVHAGLIEIAGAWATPDRERVMGEVWPGLPKIAIEYALLEPAAADGKVGTVPGSFGWSDVGDFGNLADLIDGDAMGNVVVGVGEGNLAEKPGVLLQDAHRCIVVPQSDRLLCVLGASDLVVVDTADVVLVCARDRVQDVKHLVESLRERGSDLI